MKLIWSTLLTACILLILTCQIEGGSRARERRRSTPRTRIGYYARFGIEQLRRLDSFIRDDLIDQPPQFTYCPSSWNISTSAVSTVVTWTTPSATDDYSTPVITQTSGHSSGTILGEGTYRVAYSARDSQDHTASCSFTVTVEIIRCPTIPTASNRWHACTYGEQGGSQCSFSCQSGYKLNGADRVHCTSSTRKWSTAFPTCSAMTCNPPLPNPVNGLITCTDGNRFMSMCSFVCLPGYSIPPGQVSARLCNGVIWSGTQPTCQEK